MGKQRHWYDDPDDDDDETWFKAPQVEDDVLDEEWDDDE